MTSIVQTYGYDDVPGTKIGPAGKRLLQPKLLQLYLTALLGFLFPFATFLVFFLVGDARASVLELNLGAEGPALTEVVA